MLTLVLHLIKALTPQKAKQKFDSDIAILDRDIVLEAEIDSVDEFENIC